MLHEAIYVSIFRRRETRRLRRRPSFGQKEGKKEKPELSLNKYAKE